MQISEELKKKAKTAKSTEELLKIAEENHIEITPEQAESYYSTMHTEGQLSDAELDNVAGGECGSNSGTWVCPYCKSYNIVKFGVGNKKYYCKNCTKYFKTPKFFF